jgi:hypothetical protein
MLPPVAASQGPKPWRNATVKLRLDFRTINRALVVLLVLVMATTVGFELRLGAFRLPVTPADVLVGLAFVGVVLDLFSRRLRGLRVPPIQAFLLVATAAVALARAQQPLGAAKEVLQFVEYFLVAYFVFVNVTESGDLRRLLVTFGLGTAILIAWAVVQYLSPSVSAFDVRGSYGNRNQLGALLAIALPFLYGIAVHARRWLVRIVLLVLVAAGLLVMLSGGALLVVLVVLGILSALRGQRALVPYMLVIVLLVLGAPRILPRPYHAETLFSSLALYVRDNYLLTNEELSATARERFEPTREVILDHSGERGLLTPRPYLAKRLLDLRRLREGSFNNEDREYYGRVYAAWQEVPDRDDKLDKPVVAVRYRRWDAALTAARGLASDMRDLLFGRGFIPYHDILDILPGESLQYRTDERDLYNIGASEPFTHNVWLKTLLQMGLVGLVALVWLALSFLARAVRLHGAAHSEYALGASLGAIGAILGFAGVGLFTENLGRGLAIPFVFVLAVVAILERIVYGDPKQVMPPTSRMD